MQIQLEAQEKHSIQAYTDKTIQINHITYETSLIVSQETLLAPWDVKNPGELNLDLFQPILNLNPEVIILGTQNPDQLRQQETLFILSEKQIGIECMHIESACRTFNILLSEYRRVVAGFIF